MKTFNLIKLTAIAVFAFVVIIGTADVASAQRDRRNDDRNDRNDRKRDDKAEKARAKAEQARIHAEQQRQAYWNVQNARVRAQQQRQSTWNDRNNRSGVSIVFGDNNTNRDGRYRVYRDGSYYQTDYRGAELLRNAVNEGYRQGFQAGRNDRNSNRRISWSTSNVYRSGNYGYQSHVTRSQYQYYFQQGFQRGYQDGSNSRYANDYNGQYEYGSYENGSVNILGTILSTILNIRSY